MEHKNKVGGRHSCATCNHPDRQDIDQQLAALVPLRRLSKRYGISIAALSNHNNRHVSKSAFASIRRVRNGVSSKSPKSVRERVEEGLVALEELMKSSAANKEHSQWLAAYR